MVTSFWYFDCSELIWIKNYCDVKDYVVAVVMVLMTVAIVPVLDDGGFWHARLSFVLWQCIKCTYTGCPKKGCAKIKSLTECVIIYLNTFSLQFTDRVIFCINSWHLCHLWQIPCLSPTALNFGFDFVLLVNSFRTPCTYLYSVSSTLCICGTLDWALSCLVTMYMVLVLEYIISTTIRRAPHFSLLGLVGYKTFVHSIAFGVLIRLLKKNWHWIQWK